MSVKEGTASGQVREGKGFLSRNGKPRATPCPFAPISNFWLEASWHPLGQTGNARHYKMCRLRWTLSKSERRKRRKN